VIFAVKPGVIPDVLDFLVKIIATAVPTVTPAPISDVIHQLKSCHPGKAIRKPPITRKIRGHKVSLPTLSR
jgi:hypothetical protein